MDKSDFTLDYWRARAEEARTIAEQLRDPQAKSGMLRVAEGYDHLADRREAQQRTDQVQPA